MLDDGMFERSVLFALSVQVLIEVALLADHSCDWTLVDVRVFLAKRVLGIEGLSIFALVRLVLSHIIAQLGFDLIKPDCLDHGWHADSHNFRVVKRRLGKLQ
jgi:hypothetical protein